MSDTPDDKPADKPDEGKDERDTTRTVPLSELQKERREKRALADRLEQLEQEAEERKRSEMSEVEAAKERADKAEAKVAELTDSLTKRDREQWIRDAASKANFLDPDDATKFIDAKGIEDEAAARAAVKELAQTRKHLISKETEKPDLKKVLDDGKPVNGDQPSDKDRPAKYTPDEIRGMTGEQVAADLDEVNRSLALSSR